MVRWRALVAFSLALVMGTASVGACALFCDLSRPAPVAEAPAVAPPCHQAAPAAPPLPGPGYGRPVSHCPVLAALSGDGRDTVVPAAGRAFAFPLGLWPAALPASALEMPLPRPRASRRLALVAAHSVPLPLYLERGVLRI